MTDARATALFAKLGIMREREPDWITEGRKADFYCSGHQPFWCEVKTLERLPDSQMVGEALADLGARARAITLPGRGIAYIGAGTSLCQPAHESEVSSECLEQAVIAPRQWRGAALWCYARPALGVEKSMAVF